MNAKLQLRFPNRRPADYWIFFLDPEYRVAGVSNADGSALWVFSRRRAIDEKLLQSVLDEAKEQGVDIARAKSIATAVRTDGARTAAEHVTS